MIENLGKGAFPDLPDGRDFKASGVMGAVLVDWNTPVSFPEPPSNDQNGSSSCVAQAWSYYHWQFKNLDFSRRDIYSQIFLPGGGAYIRDGGLRIVNFGQETRNLLPDPTPETEVGMQDKTGIDPNKEKINQELNSFIVNPGIDEVANAIKLYKGVVFGVTGSNEGWQDLANPRPPLAGETTWGHALYLFGYHLHDGVKCVIAKSSWGTAGNTTVHHIKENYFTSGNTFSAWTLIPKQLINKPMYKKVKYADGKTLGVLVISPNGDQIIKATSEDVWRSFSDPNGYNLATINPDGTTNWNVDIQLPF